MLAASDYAQAVGSQFEEVVAEVYGVYEGELMRMNAMDFDDLLFRTVNLLELFEEVRTRYAQAFKHVLVDEYQDTNHAQYRLLQLLVGGGRAKPTRGERVNIPGHRNLAVVGDDSQSIYGFRGADVSNILDFTEDFPDARVVKLEQNYRSTQTILSAANAVIANNRGGIAKRLWSEKGQGSPIRVHGLEDEHAEARFVVGEIERLLDEGASRAEIAVFYRTNAMSRVIEDTLVRREIAYQVIGGTKFYERAEIKDAIAYWCWSPTRTTWSASSAWPTLPGAGSDRRRCRGSWPTRPRSASPSGRSPPRPSAGPGTGRRRDQGAPRFMDTMDELAMLAPRMASRWAICWRRCSRVAGYVEALEAEAGEDKDVRGAGAHRKPATAASRWHASSTPTPAEPKATRSTLFLQQLALVADADSRPDDEGLITLMTLHNAKGLEYPTVFVAGCEDGVFPHQRALDEGGVEEERRLFYVGCH